MAVDEKNDALIIAFTADIVAAHVSSNSVPLNDIADLIANVHGALSSLDGTSDSSENAAKPSVSIRSSVGRDYLICLEDGTRHKLLKRHLRTQHGMTPVEYRQRWGLNGDYPMVAPDYAKKRSLLAKSIGLGTVGRAKLKAKKK